MVGIDDIKRGIENNLGAVALGAGIVTAGAVVGAVALSRKKAKKRNSGKRARDRRYISKQKHEVAYQKRRRKLGKKTYGKRYKSRKHSKKGIHYTKKGQPYKILSSGKARFIKKSKLNGRKR